MKMFQSLSSKAHTAAGTVKKWWAYCSTGVWTDTRKIWKVNMVKTLNLSLRSFLNSDIQSKSCALTYRTMLAIVPMLAIFFAIGRGFGLQDVLRDELMSEFSTQSTLLERVLEFVNSYLNQSSEGWFVGIGIIVLLWTLISLLNSVEKVFNDIWGIKQDRSLWRKCTDYLAIFLVLPILMICSSGITIVMSTTLEKLLPYSFVTPLTGFLLDAFSLVMVWLFFTGVYMLVPNTKVKFKNAFATGVLSGTAYMILQWLFISGTVYISKYNAIYGSFAFVPLFLVWMQLVWVVTLSGAVICFSSQNIFQYNFSNEVARISPRYRQKIIVSIMAVIVDAYEKKCTPPTEYDISTNYGIPISLVTKSVNVMLDAGLILRTVTNPKVQVYGFVPSSDPSRLTVGYVIEQLRNYGTTEFVPGFKTRFSKIIKSINDAEQAMQDVGDRTLIKDVPVEAITAEDLNQTEQIDNQH